jgi:hypothetical protein
MNGLGGEVAAGFRRMRTEFGQGDKLNDSGN